MSDNSFKQSNFLTHVFFFLHSTIARSTQTHSAPYRKENRKNEEEKFMQIVALSHENFFLYSHA